MDNQLLFNKLNINLDEVSFEKLYKYTEAFESLQAA